MSIRQWWVLALSVGAIMSVLAFGTSRLPSPVVGPLVEYAPGQYSRDVTDAVLPKWVLLTALGLAALTGAALYWTRTVREAP